MAAKLVNRYERRTASEPRDCYVCRKTSSTVLHNDADFLFTCESHLSDVAFCVPLAPPEPPKTESSTPEKRDQKEDSKDPKAKDGETKATPIPTPKLYKLTSAYFRMREERLAKRNVRAKAASSNLLAQLPSVPTTAPQKSSK